MFTGTDAAESLFTFSGTFVGSAFLSLSRGCVVGTGLKLSTCWTFPEVGGVWCADEVDAWSLCEESSTFMGGGGGGTRKG